MDAMDQQSSMDHPLRDLATWVSRSVTVVYDLWLIAMFFPWRCFRSHVRPRDQSLAIVFAMAMVAVWAVVRAIFGALAYPTLGSSGWLSAAIWVSLLVVVVTPVALHLLAAVATVILIAVAPERGGVSETVQVIAFSMAPVPLLGIDLVGVRAISALYGFLLMWYGVRVVHRVPFERALLVVALPSYMLYAMGFRVDAALAEILRHWYIL